MGRAEEDRVPGALGGHVMNLEHGKDPDTGPSRPEESCSFNSGCYGKQLEDLSHGVIWFDLHFQKNHSGYCVKHKPWGVEVQGAAGGQVSG